MMKNWIQVILVALGIGIVLNSGKTNNNNDNQNDNPDDKPDDPNNIIYKFKNGQKVYTSVAGAIIRNKVTFQTVGHFVNANEIAGTIVGNKPLKTSDNNTVNWWEIMVTNQQSFPGTYLIAQSVIK